MKEIQMRMSEICDLIGISPQGIRLYEKHKAITSFKKEDNGYRYYYFENLASAIGLRSYKNLGITIKDSVSLCSGVTPDEINNSLHEREKEILDEIKRQEALLECNRAMARALKYILNGYNKFEFCERPSMYFLKCEENGEILKDKEARKLIRAWSNKIPLVKFLPVIEKEDLDKYVVAKVGFGVKEVYAKFISDINTERVKYYPSRKCIGGFVRVEEGTTDYFSVIEPGLVYLKENDLELDGDIFTVLIAPSILANGVAADYYYAWYPIKGKYDN